MWRCLRSSEWYPVQICLGYRASPIQPQGEHPRREASDADRKKVHDVALSVLKDGAISQKSCDYLTQWAKGTRRRLPRLPEYTFLNHRVTPNGQAPQDMHAHRPRLGHVPGPVLVAADGNHEMFLPAEAELDNDVDGDELVIEDQRDADGDEST